MSTLQPMAFDVFSGDEAALMQKIIEERADDAWAKPMIAAINRNGGLVGGNKDRFLELRFGHALRKAGINPCCRSRCFAAWPSSSIISTEYTLRASCARIAV
jgi:hypothetical protein